MAADQPSAVDQVIEDRRRTFMQDVRKRGPEAVTWDTMKGKRVIVFALSSLDNDGKIEGRLVWVDRFSIGVEQESTPFYDQRIVIVHKGPGLCITLAGRQGEESNG